MSKPELNDWNPPPKRRELYENEVHVWRAKLHRSAGEIEEFRGMLSPDEEQRSRRFYFDRDRHDFIVGRGILRSILSGYLNIKAEKIAFEYRDRGKPGVANPGDRAIEFNVSHSNGLALYAVTRDRPIGIDVEYLRPLRDAEQLANRFFTPPEVAAIAALAPEKKQAAFFHAWTRKEAYLKATGEGLAGLERVEVSVSPEMPAKLLSIGGDRQLASCWFLCDIHPHPAYLAALAIEGEGHLCYFSWEHE